MARKNQNESTTHLDIGPVLEAFIDCSAVWHCRHRVPLAVPAVPVRTKVVILNKKPSTQYNGLMRIAVEVMRAGSAKTANALRLLSPTVVLYRWNIAKSHEQATTSKTSHASSQPWRLHELTFSTYRRMPLLYTPPEPNF